MRISYIDPHGTDELQRELVKRTGIVVVDGQDSPIGDLRADDVDCVVVAAELLEDEDRIGTADFTEKTPLVAVVPEGTSTLDAIDAGATDAIERDTLRERPSMLVDRVIAAIHRIDRPPNAGNDSPGDTSVDSQSPGRQIASEGSVGSEPAGPVSDDPGEVSPLRPTDHDDVPIDGEFLAAACGVFEAIVGAEDRRTLVRGVLDAFVSTERWTDAWYGRYDLVDGTVIPTVTRGLDVDPLDPWDGTDQTKAVRDTIEQTVPQQQDPSDAPAFPGHDDRLVPHAVVPINDGAVIHGLWFLYTESPRRPTDEELALFGLVGRATGVVATAQQRRQALAGEGEIEIKVELLEDDAFLSLLSEGGYATTESYTIDGDGATISYYRTDADPATIRQLTEERAGVETWSIVADDGDSRLLRVETAPVDNLFALANEYGLAIFDATATDGRTYLVLGVPSDADIRELLNLLTGLLGEIDLLAVRERSRTGTLGSTIDALGENLTDRQYEVLLAAYHGGFYEWPRDSTGEEIAESLEISQPTFTQHRRSAERTVVELLLDRSRTLGRS